MKKLLNDKIKPVDLVIDRKKKIAFNLILILIPILLFLMVEFGLRIFNYGHDLSLFVKSKNYPGFCEINRNVTLRYFTKLETTSPTSDIFLKEKPDTCFRVFVFGESTTRGFPYQEGTSFPTILYYRLQDAFPDKRIEVVNLAASAINSYSYIDMLNEVLDNKPDLILVYGGHNEYYGALGVGSVESGGNVRWIKKLRLKLCKLRSFQLIQNIISGSNSIFSQNGKNGDGTLMSRIVKDKDILINSKLYEAGIKQYQDNMIEFVEKAKRKQVPVILSNLINNIKDQAPFKSAYVEGTPVAIDVYNEAIRLENKGEFKEAKELYYKAKDLDVIRFRSPEAINEVIENISKKYQLPLVPMKNYFEMQSPNQLIGNNLILEHLHPNIDGYFLMADAFFNTIKENKFISKNWNTTKIKPSVFYRNHWGFTELDSLIGDLNIKSLQAGWPYKPENDVASFVLTYKPVGFVDSMAFAYLTGDFSTRHIEDEHIKLAHYYSQKGLNDKAFNEYFSLIKLHPYIADLYYDASKYLIAQQKFSEAYDLINSAPLMEKNYFFYYMNGTLKLKMNEIQQGIMDLEFSYKIITPDAKPITVLMPLFVAYSNLGDEKNKNRVIGLIQQYMPNFGKEQSEDTTNREVKNLSVDETINKAELFIKNNDLNRAKDLLFSANKERETFKANKLLGVIYIMQKENDLAYEFCMKAYKLNSTEFDNLNNLFILCLLRSDLNSASNLLNELRALNVDPNKIQRLEGLYLKRKNEIESK